MQITREVVGEVSDGQIAATVPELPDSPWVVLETTDTRDADTFLDTPSTSFRHFDVSEDEAHKLAAQLNTDEGYEEMRGEYTHSLSFEAKQMSLQGVSAAVTVTAEYRDMPKPGGGN